MPGTDPGLEGVWLGPNPSLPRVPIPRGLAARRAAHNNSKGMWERHLRSATMLNIYVLGAHCFENSMAGYEMSVVK